MPKKIPPAALQPDKIEIDGASHPCEIRRVFNTIYSQKSFCDLEKSYLAAFRTDKAIFSLTKSSNVFLHRDQKKISEDNYSFYVVDLEEKPAPNLTGSAYFDKNTADRNLILSDLTVPHEGSYESWEGISIVIPRCVLNSKLKQTPADIPLVFSDRDPYVKMLVDTIVLIKERMDSIEKDRAAGLVDRVLTMLATIINSSHGMVPNTDYKTVVSAPMMKQDIVTLSINKGQSHCCKNTAMNGTISAAETFKSWLHQLNTTC